MTRKLRTGRNPSPKDLADAKRIAALNPDAQRMHPSSVAADPSKLTHINSYGSLPEYYIDQPFRCCGCGKEEIWRARTAWGLAPALSVALGSVVTRGAAGERRDGAISPADVDRVVRLLQHDLVETVGSGHEVVVTEAAARLRLFSEDPADFEQRVVEDVQQRLHDTFVDTSWPACPEHLNHPLSYAEGSWRCEKSGKRVAALGGLSRRAVQ